MPGAGANLRDELDAGNIAASGALGSKNHRVSVHVVKNVSDDSAQGDRKLDG
ncbi:hypothetical protein [Manganibacter manganicus]|uniref:hypothetical protein n=1 Tax=Manganibacter manganicus TaxID=1873176 RepID=UPI001301C8C6|nr:hypothetical protein [Pseudaminobacter manganicus]